MSPASGIKGGTDNEVHLITSAGNENCQRLSKDEVATRLAARITAALA